MHPIHTASNCRWAQPDVFVPLPGWVAVWQSPWKCVDDHLAPVPLDTRPDCSTCTWWKERGTDVIGWVMTQVAI
jgi:hypothetical protein